MEKATATFIVNRLEKTGVITPSQRDLYIYGFELLLSFLVGFSVIIIIGFLLGIIPETLIFLVIFIFVRQCTGGFHADTYLKCKLFTVFAYICVMTVSHHIHIPMLAYVIIIPIGLIFVVLTAPIENIHKPLDSKQKKRNKAAAIILYILVGGFGFVIRQYNTQYGYVVFNTLSVIIILMVIPFAERRLSHETRSE